MSTLRFREQMTYKYGASDAFHQHLGTVPLLMWGIIEYAKSHGYRELDLCRSAPDHEGLLRFKDRLAARRMTLDYQRHPSRSTAAPTKARGLRMGNRVLA